MSKFEKIIHSVFLGLVVIMLGLYIFDVQGRNDKDFSNEALITSDEAAEYLSMSESRFEELIENQIGLKEEAIGMNVNDNAFIDWLTFDEEKYFNPEQLSKWVEYNIYRKAPIIPE